MIRSGTLGMMRSLALKLLTQTCSIATKDAGTDVYGYPSQDFTVVASDVRCRLLPAGQGTTNEAGQVSNRETITEEYRLILPHDQAIGPDYRVTVDAVEYEVIRLLRFHTDAITREALVVRSA